jgi:hypothetical protein
MSEEQIKNLDAAVVSAFEPVVTNANQTLEQAELARRANQQLYETQIAPALDGWGSEKANLEAQNAYYKTLAEKAKESGFIPADTPFQPPAAAARGANGQYVAGGNPVPGSPGADMGKLEENLGNAFGTISDLQWKYQSLFGAHMPDSPTALMREAQSQRLPLMDYAARKYNFQQKQQELETKKQKEHDDAIRAEVAKEKDREFAERSSGNPNLVTPAGNSRFAEVRKAVTEGQRKDPLTLSREERRSSTRSAIHQEIAENAVA